MLDFQPTTAKVSSLEMFYMLSYKYPVPHLRSHKKKVCLQSISMNRTCLPLSLKQVCPPSLNLR